jgi:hypothetical protein
VTDGANKAVCKYIPFTENNILGKFESEKQLYSSTVRTIASYANSKSDVREPPTKKQRTRYTKKEQPSNDISVETDGVMASGKDLQGGLQAKLTENTVEFTVKTSTEFTDWTRFIAEIKYTGKSTVSAKTWSGNDLSKSNVSQLHEYCEKILEKFHETEWKQDSFKETYYSDVEGEKVNHETYMESKRDCMVRTTKKWTGARLNELLTVKTLWCEHLHPKTCISLQMGNMCMTVNHEENDGITIQTFFYDFKLDGQPIKHLENQSPEIDQVKEYIKYAINIFKIK